MPPDFKDQKQFYCDQCPDVFLTKHSLHLHRIKWHPTGKDFFIKYWKHGSSHTHSILCALTYF